MGIFSSFFGNLFDDRPAVNIDGTPMSGDFDINGNPYGVTQSDDFTIDGPSHDSLSADVEIESSTFDSCSSISSDDCFSSSTSAFSTDDSFSPSFEVDDAFSSDFSISDDSFSSSWDD